MRRVPVVQVRVLLARALLASALLVAMLGATPVQAELVVLTTGDFLHAETVRVDGESVRLVLPSGGLLVVPLGRVERVLDDEVADRRDEPPPVPRFSLRWDAAVDEPPVPAVPYGELMHAAARRHGLNPRLVEAVARAESAFRADAVSPKGARGLMQLMPATARRFGLEPDQAFEPASALDAGARYLRWLADRFADDLPRVLAAYNAGEGTVDRYGGVPPYRETREYVRRIVAHLGLEATVAERSR
ncbi:MAG: lytic transglycosylase domain-containing protein [Acidobacteriota bacterium]